MSLRLSGLVAGGVDQALQDVLQRRFQEAVRQQQERQHQDQLALQRETLAAANQDRQALRSFQLDQLQRVKDTDAADLAQAATDRNVGMDAAHVLAVPGMTREAQANELTQSALRNPNSRATPGIMKVIEGLTKIPPVDPIAQHRAIKQVDQEFEKPTKPEKPAYQKFVVNGKEQMLTAEEVRQMGGIPVKPPQKAVTGAERLAMNFYNRGVEGHTTASALENKIGQMSLLEQTRLQSAPNFLQSQDGQTYRQAQREFTEARLRKESGAAIPPAEYQNDARTYFAQPGDTPATLMQKKTARETILKGLKNEARRAITEFESGSPEDPTLGDVAFVFNPATGKLEPVKQD